jgi:hypothetical protein
MGNIHYDASIRRAIAQEEVHRLFWLGNAGLQHSTIPFLPKILPEYKHLRLAVPSNNPPQDSPTTGKPEHEKDNFLERFPRIRKVSRFEMVRHLSKFSIAAHNISQRVLI